MDDYSKFKNLLWWFVNQLNINNGVTDGEKLFGWGYKDSSSLRVHYGEWRNYSDFGLECTLAAGYQSAFSGSNYINLAGTSFNVIPEFDDNKAVKSLYIGNHPPKTPIDRKSQSVDVTGLGLFDDGEPNQVLKRFYDQWEREISAFRNEGEKKQRAAFKSWYARKVGSANSANTISTAIGKARLKDGRAIFAITDFTELDTAINAGGLNGYFRSSDGDYSKMSVVFDIESNTQQDDLKSGIKHYLSFLKDTLSGGRERNAEQNLILYGPPGTGKTYTTVMYAVSIIDGVPLDEIKEQCKTKKQHYEAVIKPRYDELKALGLIEFATFHQSFSYEEFIEGIRPVVSEENADENDTDIRYEIVSGIFKRFCESVKHGNVSSNQDLFEKAWQKLVETAKQNNGDYTFTRKTGTTFKSTLIKDTVFRVSWDSANGSHNDLTMTGVINQWMSDIDRSSLAGGNRWLFDARQAIINELETKYNLKYADNEIAKNYVFIIDEINRGDISRIFGELITLIEPSKRIDALEAQTVVLPYSKKKFGVPDNVYIIGTMNTADRSIALLDTALRRRFNFVEMMPDINLLEGITIDDGEQGIDIERLLQTLNDRITVLLDREHTIGHSFFLGLTSESTIKDLKMIFQNNIIPLLQEYFYDDYEKIRLVLGDNQKKDGQPQFIIKREVPSGLFGGDVDDAANFYEINKAAFKESKAYEYLIK